VNKTDYINASLVEVKDVDRRYILTQGPLSNTVAHFWALVWEQVS
jgi:protein tyrosine phosphatase